MIFDKVKNFAIHTLGCKVNLYESNVIRNELTSYGLVEFDFKQKADLYIINTCSVTNNADSKSRNIIARARKINPNAIILVCGCFSQVAKENLKANIIIGNKYKNNIISLLEEYLKTQEDQLVKIDNLLLEKEFEETNIEFFENNTRAFIKIQDGCNHMCSYCIIPFTRGRQRNKDINIIVSEIKTLISKGYKEIVLTGVNTAGYNDEKNHVNFYQLLKIINDIEGEFRIRISSVEPFQITHKIVDLVANNPKFAQHWHICLQSGSDRILTKMNRKYTTNEFRDLVNYIYSLNPLTSITTDYICGFPTETDDDHQKSLEFCSEIGFYQMHVFPYSKRKYTPASNMEQVNENIKKIRVNDFLELNKKLEKKFIEKFINKTVKVLFEREISKNKYVGKASEYFDVIVESKENLINKMKDVEITKVIFNSVIGELKN